MRRNTLVSIPLSLILMFPLGTAIPQALAEDQPSQEVTVVDGTTDTATADEQGQTTTDTTDTTTTAPATTSEDAATGVSATTTESSDTTGLSLTLDPTLLTTYSALKIDPAATTSTNVETYAGADRLETSALQATAAFSSSEYVIIVGSQNWPDALSAAGLAGALDCPILLSNSTDLADSTKDALEKLGVTKTIIVGGTSAVADNVKMQVSSVLSENATAQGISATAENSNRIIRISGTDRYQTQLQVYQYGIEHGYWSDSMVIIASGSDFADALSISPVAYSQKCPIFITDSTGNLTDAQMSTLITGAKDKGMFKSVVVAGGDGRITDLTEGFAWAISQISSGNTAKPTRLSGADRYETSAAIAEWAVSQGYLSWDGAGIASGTSYPDSIGGATMQGKLGSVLLLANSWSDASVKALIAHGSSVTSSIRYFGGYNSVSAGVRGYIASRLGIADIQYVNYDISLSNLASMEDAVDNASYNYDSYEEFYNALNPDNYAWGDPTFYQFAVLNQGYSGAVTAQQLNEFIDAKATAAENSHLYAAWGAGNGVYSTMRGMGQAFIDAAAQYNVNEVYLVAIAGLESAWGTSTLACGQVYSDGVVYYNFFGIGAYDSNANYGGLVRAASLGWSSPYLAILGGGSWISSSYLNNSYGPQDSFYYMKWDLYHAVNDGSVWHQYCTGCTWQLYNARNLAEIYDYLGIPMNKTGLSFEVPVYAGN